jgi:hypothetical protein
VTRDGPAEILVSADARNGRDITFFSAGRAGNLNIFIFMANVEYSVYNGGISNIRMIG